MVESRTQIIATIAAAAIAASAVIGVFLYQNYYDIPVLTYDRLVPYPTGEGKKVSSLVIENEGQKKATNLRIIIETVGPTVIIYKESLEELAVSGEGSMEIVIEAPRLVQGSKITLFLGIETESNLPISRLSLISDEGLGIPKGAPNTPETLRTVFSLLVFGAASIGGMILISFVMGDRLGKLLEKEINERSGNEQVSGQLHNYCHLPAFQLFFL